MIPADAICYRQTVLFRVLFGWLRIQVAISMADLAMKSDSAVWLEHSVRQGLMFSPEERSIDIESDSKFIPIGRMQRHRC